MSGNSAVDSAAHDRDRQWFIVGRWQEFEGEGRANLLRIVVVAALYSLQLLQVHWLAPADQRADEAAFHRFATAGAVAASLVSLAVLVCLRSRILPAALKYLSVVGDILILTMLAATGGGPQSPLVFVYFLVVALASLRFSLPLVWFATAGCMLGYLAVVGASDARWFDSEHLVRPVDQLVVVTSLALTGVMLGQMIRRVRTLADDYARRLELSSPSAVTK